MNNLWVISEFYYPAGNATGYILTQIVDTIAQSRDVNIITVGEPIAERSERITTHRVKDIKSLDKNKLIERILKQMIISFRLLWMVLRKVKKGDTVFTVTNPAFMLIFIAFVKGLKKVKLVILVHDVFPENLVVTGITTEKSISYRIAKKLFTYAYRKGDLLIAIGRDMQRQMRKKVKSPEKVIFLPNFGDTDAIVPMDRNLNPILIEQGLLDKFVVLFTGNMGRLQGIDNLLEAMKLLVKDPDIHFLFIGEGAMEGKMRKFIADNELSNVTILTNMPRERANDFLNAGDVGLVSLQANIMGTGVPSKTNTYMAAGKPILAVMDEDSEIALAVSENGIGWVADPTDPHALAKILSEIKHDKALIKEKSLKSRQTALESYSMKKVTQKYTDAILNLK